ncbi:MAG: radical SAM protein [Planctomycetes bacterium]|nr:radical SAM protein [Planctomycetota bacterium]
MLDLLGTTAQELAARAAAEFGPRKGAGVAKAVHRAAVREGVFEPEAHGLGATAAATWRQFANLQLPQPLAVAHEQVATGLVEKHLLRLGDGETIECVALPMGRGRSSLCLSTQVGCARACTFCATGRLGLRRNLSAGEIVAQVVLAQRTRRPDTLVFQGMGEPLDNLPGLLGALRVLTDPHGLAYAQDQLTVCTIGHVPGLAALRDLGWKRLGLSLSLHAANEPKRRELLRHGARYRLDEIHRALVAYRQRTNFALGLHWCLLPGVNDTAADAAELAAFATGLGRCHVHLIPYNPDHEPVGSAPTDAEVTAFATRLRAHGLAVRARVVKGRSVGGACGQLRGGR